MMVLGWVGWGGGGGVGGSIAVHYSKEHFLSAMLDILIYSKLGAPRSEPGAAG